MVEILHIDAINRQIDEEFARAKAKYGPRQFDIIVLENSCGDTISDVDMVGALRHLNRTGSRYKVALRHAAEAPALACPPPRLARIVQP